MKSRRGSIHEHLTSYNFVPVMYYAANRISLVGGISWTMAVILIGKKEKKSFSGLCISP